MRVLPFLEEAAVLEDVVSNCYGALADLAANPEISREFLRIEREECNHARIIRAGKNYVQKAPDLFGQENVDVAEIQFGLSSAKEILEDIRDGEVSLRDAVIKVRDLEARFEKIHLDTVIVFHDETLRELFRNMARDDGDHGQALEGILKKLG